MPKMWKKITTKLLSLKIKIIQALPHKQQSRPHHNIATLNDHKDEFTFNHYKEWTRVRNGRYNLFPMARE
jgi:hypothetical protein